MSNDVNYLPVCVKEPKKAFQFLSQYLDFSDRRNMDPELNHVSKQKIITGNRLGNNYMLLSRPDTTYNNNEEVMVYTDDCLRDYHQLCSAGVKVEQIPRYTCKGLEVVVSDNCGNKYILLEKRDYSDI